MQNWEQTTREWEEWNLKADNYRIIATINSKSDILIELEISALGAREHCRQATLREEKTENMLKPLDHKTNCI